MKIPISVVVLTYNEEKNIKACLESVCDFVQDIFVVDSYSEDKTIDIAKQYTNNVVQHKFETYPKQRNWALENLPIKTDWILNLDADVRVTQALKDELVKTFANGEEKNCNGFSIPKRTIFMGKWMKHGWHYPVYHTILFKKGCGRWEDIFYEATILVDGDIKKLKGDFEDILTDKLSNFISRHNHWSTWEAVDYLDIELKFSNKKRIDPSLLPPPNRKRRNLEALYMKFPLFIRAFMYYFYRYFFKLGFMDGAEGLIFHFLQGFWYRFLVDAKIYEVKKKMREENKSIQAAIKDLYDISV